MTDPQPLPNPESAHFYERQYFRQKWLTGLFAILLLLVIGFPMIDMYAEPDRQAELISTMTISGVLMLALMVTIRQLSLQVWVMADAIHIRFWPFVHHRIIQMSEVGRHEAVTYRPIVEYGGWGQRGAGNDRVFNVRGNRGVMLSFNNGGTLLIGSQQSDEFADTLSSVST
jgi:hypothetical protein